jgi:transcriptional regulator with XRE-family HTH domain
VEPEVNGASGKRFSATMVPVDRQRVFLREFTWQPYAEVAYPHRIQQSASIAAQDVNDMASDSINRFIGSRVRARRLNLGIEAATFAGDLGLAIRDLEEFEIGAKPIGAALLQRIGKILLVPAMYFFQQEPEQPLTLNGVYETDREPDVPPQGLNLGNAMHKITDPDLREQLMLVVQALVQARPRYRS